MVENSAPPFVKGTLNADGSINSNAPAPSAAEIKAGLPKTDAPPGFPITKATVVPKKIMPVAPQTAIDDDSLERLKEQIAERRQKDLRR